MQTHILISRVISFDKSDLQYSAGGRFVNLGVVEVIQRTGFASIWGCTLALPAPLAGSNGPYIDLKNPDT